MGLRSFVFFQGPTPVRWLVNVEKEFCGVCQVMVCVCLKERWLETTLRLDGE